MRQKVSINILNYNTYEKSCVCIDSCLTQIGVDYRILLIDNASTDNSFIKLRTKYGKKIDYYQTGSNCGFSGGNNIGVKYCYSKGYKYALLLNSDTEIKSKTLLSDLLKIIINNKNCAVVSPTIYDVTKYGLIKHTNDYFYNKLLRMINVLPSKRKISEQITSVSEAHGSAMLINCKRFIEVGGFPEHYFMYCEESTFAKKTIWKGYDILWSKNNTNYIYHHHDKSGIVAPWRLFLMGRNRAIEYYENYNNKFWLWRPLFFVYKIKMFIEGLRTHNMNYYKGLISGEELCERGMDKKQIYNHGIQIMKSLN